MKSEGSDAVVRREVGRAHVALPHESTSWQEVKMSKVKAGGSSKNNRDSAGKRLGVKLYTGQPVKTGQVIVRQTGASKRAGKGTFMSRDYTIHAKQDGVVRYQDRKYKKFTGKSVPRTEVVVE